MTRYRYFESQIISFKLLNALTNSQKFINKILAKKLNIFVIVFLDNIFFYIKDQDQNHVDAVHSVLEKLQKYKLYANLKKCYLY